MTVKPCPHCGGNRIVRCNGAVKSREYMRCRDCGAHGPEADNRFAAIEVWNTRASDIALQAIIEKQAEEISRLTSERRNLISHGIGGYTEAVDSMSLNEACVAISAFRNRTYAAGQANGRNSVLEKLHAPDATMLEAVAKALGLHEFIGHKPTVRWPENPSDCLSRRDGSVPVTWDFAEKCRTRAAAALSATADALGNTDVR